MKDISAMTSIKTDDVISTLQVRGPIRTDLIHLTGCLHFDCVQSLGIIKYYKGQHLISVRYGGYVMPIVCKADGMLP